MVKLGPRGHTQWRMHTGYTAPAAADPTKVLTGADFGISESGDGPVTTSKEAGINLYADSYVPSFFRRLTFTPDGQLLLTPTGIHRPPSNVSHSKSFCTHVYSRQQLMQNSSANSSATNSGSSISPCLSLIGLEDPSVAVRCCPRLFKLQQSASPSLIPGDYR